MRKLTPFLLVWMAALAHADTPKARVDVAIANFKKTNAFTGAAVVVVDHGTSYHFVYGVADPATGAPFADDTLFAIASITKTFTGLLYVWMAENGYWHYDSLTRALTPECGAGNQSFCPMFNTPLYDLATHNAGLPRLEPSWVTTPMGSVKALHDCVGLDAGGQQACDWPGTSEHYSNWGFDVLGALESQVLSGNYGEWFDNLEFFVTEPLFLFDTRVPTAWIPSYFNQHRAKDFPDAGQPNAPAFNSNAVMGPTGLLWSTMPDMNRYLQFMMGHADLAPSQLTALLPILRVAHVGNAGYGWFVQNNLAFTDGKKRDVLWKIGGLGGFHSYIGMPTHPNSSPNRAATGVFVIVNRAPATGDANGEALQALGQALLAQFPE
jgi:CubicO group peptidase (beta-lactamase class C family)